MNNQSICKRKSALNFLYPKSKLEDGDIRNPAFQQRQTVEKISEASRV